MSKKDGINMSRIYELWLPTQKADEEPGILESEVRAAIQKLKSRKTLGVDRVDGDLIRHGGEAMVKTTFTICNKIWVTGKFPKLWTQSLILTIPKKGDTTKCENSLTIILICHALKSYIST